MSSRSKKLKIDPNEEFCFNSNNKSKSSDTFSFESLKLCCLFWQNFSDYNRKIDEEKLFHYPHFEFIIFQLTVYIQQNNINNYELYSNYSSPTNSSSGEISITTKEIKTATSTVTSTTITQQNIDKNNDNNNNNNLSLFGGNFFENSSIFSMVSMVYKPSTSNAEKQLSGTLDSLDNQIIVSFGSLEYKPVNNKTSNSNSNSTVGTTSISSPENNVPSPAPLPVPSFRTLEEDDNEDEECKDDDEEENEDTYEQIMREINHAKQLFKLAKLQYIKMLESKDERHLDCPAICHIHCSHTTLPQLRILYKLKELFVNHANDMLSLCSSLPPRPM